MVIRVKTIMDGYKTQNEQVYPTPSLGGTPETIRQRLNQPSRIA
jgi:hypothetical protein